MSVMQIAQLKAGRIFGDCETNEYVYMPAGEIGAKEPLCVYETDTRRDDVSLDEALRLIRIRSLHPTCHPSLGESSC
ncbi:MAG: hypothetical protein J6Z82_01150 [Schwartzia sp.]|nr:hypothetical protein [Schwartzia sp. (in: firmicutes)]